MDIEQIRRFVAVADSGSYIHASDLLGVAQPTLSRQVRALEVELRTTLFHRHGRGVVLTEPGRRFLEHARGILHSVDASLRALDDGGAEEGGRVVIGLTPTAGRLLIPKLCNAILERFPKASVSFIEGLSGALFERTCIGQLDFAIAHNPPATGNLYVEPILTEPLYLIGRKPHGRYRDRVPLKSLAELPLILPGSHHSIRPALDREMVRLGLRLNVRVEVDSLPSILDLVRSGRGYTIAPKNLRRTAEGSDLSWQRIISPEITTTLCLIAQTRWNRSAAVVYATEQAARLFREVAG